MIEIIDKTKCCGCSSCANACPTTAIDMKPDEEGFLYPFVNSQLCIDCNACNKVCPIENIPAVENTDPEAYVLRSKNKDVLQNSTSGGFITPLATWIIENGGVLCAASYDEAFQVKHIFIDRANGRYDTELARVRGSKYVQSFLGDVFAKIERYLKNGRRVCFTGTTCQVNGLKAFLRKDYDNLIMVDLVCHGTSSPKLWSKYLAYQKDKHNSNITEVSFRNKTYGYHSGTMKICFANGSVYYGSARVDYMLKSFFSEIASRPVCYKCPFKTLKRCSDFTIYDCWHASELVENLKDDDRGYTNVIAQSEKGKNILREICDKYEIYRTDLHKAVEYDGVMVVNSAVPHKNRPEFYVDIDKRTLSEQIQQFIPVSKVDLIIEQTKGTLYRLGLLQFLRRLKAKHT